MGVEEVEGYTEGENASIDLRRLRAPSDGYMNEVHTIRDRVWADAVILLRRQGGGLADFMENESTAFAPLAFCVSGVNAATFAHELGHLMGLLHDRYVECGSNGCDRGVSADAYGYVNQAAFESGAAESKRWRTIMSYDTQCTNAGFNCQRVLYFSNPDNSYPDADGDPMGVALTPSNRNSIAVDGPADAARALNDTRDTVAEFRQGRAVKVSFAAATYTVTEGGSVTVTVQLDAAPGRTLDLPFRSPRPVRPAPGPATIPSRRALDLGRARPPALSPSGPRRTAAKRTQRRSSWALARPCPPG